MRLTTLLLIHQELQIVFGVVLVVNVVDVVDVVDVVRDMTVSYQFPASSSQELGRIQWSVYLAGTMTATSSIIAAPIVRP
jgi:hypothetical protein